MGKEYEEFKLWFDNDWQNPEVVRMQFQYTSESGAEDSGGNIYTPVEWVMEQDARVARNGDSGEDDGAFRLSNENRLLAQILLKHHFVMTQVNAQEQMLLTTN